MTAAALEAIRETEEVRDIVVRMADLDRRGRLNEFTNLVWTDRELDPSTRAWLIAVAGQGGLLRAAESRLD